MAEPTMSERVRRLVIEAAPVPVRRVTAGTALTVRPGDPDRQADSVRLGAEHAAPILGSLSVIARKRALFAVDSHFRDSWEDLCELPPDGVERILRNHALLLLKPDAVVGRRLEPALTWLAEQGTVVAAEPVRLDRHVTRVMWQHQWNVASRDRRDLADLIVRGGDSLALFVAMRPDARPATVRLSAAKGPAEPARRQSWHLRHRLGNDNFLLNFVHTADEPADLVREIGVLFDAPARRRLYREMLRGADATGAALGLVAQLYQRSPARDLSLAGLLGELCRRLDGRTGPAVDTLTSALAAVEAGLNADWRGLCDLAEAAGVPLDDWGRAVLGTHLMVASEPGTVPVLSGVPVQDWDRRPDPSILPLWWRPTGPAPDRCRPAAVARPPALRYDRTVPRQLVHKDGIDEVLVTDSARNADGAFELAAELPSTHCYFNDLPDGGARFDLMAVVELCRQAFYVVVHRHLGVPTDRMFLLGRVGVDLAPAVVFADQPERLRVNTVFEVRRLFDEPRPALSARLRFTTPDRRPVGTATMVGSWHPPAEYLRMRGEARAGFGLAARVGPPPTVPAPLASPASVGRTAERNVILAGWATEEDNFTSELVVDGAYRGMFDHEHDHAPGLLLIEAARQAAIRSVTGQAGVPARAVGLSAVRASFPATAELDLPVRLAGTATLSRDAGTGDVRVSMAQRGVEVCRISTSVAVDASGERR